MKTFRYIPLIPLMFCAATAQMPSSFDASGRSAQAQNGVQNDDPLRTGESPPPQIFGMELPLLDPANDTVSYGGGRFDLGNNAAVRERFEKYLSQTPDDSEQSRLYRRNLQEILDYTERYVRGANLIGSRVLVKIGKGLYNLSDYPGDGSQAGVLASAMVSALDVQRANRRRDQANEELDRELDELVDKTNSLTNQNTQRGSGRRNTAGGAAGSGNSGYTSHTFRIGANTAEIARLRAQQGSNIAANQASLPLAKINYQSVVLGFLLQRRYDHAVIGARVYRHLFRDGNTRLDLDENSDAYKTFTGITGMPPTINTIDSFASNARREVDQSIDAVHGALAQNKLGEATNRLITAVAAGEYMQSVATFPAEQRRRIAAYWQLRKRALSALNARDYATVESIAAQMREMDVDFDDSMLMSYTSGKKRQSNFALRAARQAFQAGNQEEFRRLATEAAMIWPQNPALDEGEAEIARVDSFAPQMEEFRRLLERREFRTIYTERERLRVVCADGELEKKYTEVLELVAGTDVLLARLKEGAEQDKTMGPCAAWEQTTLLLKEDDRYSTDPVFTEACNNFSSLAHDFVEALRYAKECEERGEYGSALSSYYRAKCFFTGSKLAAEGIERVTKVIVNAQY